MSEMVDRVADAICEYLQTNGFPFIGMKPLDDESLARAVIEAMREPTKQMIAACEPEEDAGPIWRDMIDAALKIAAARPPHHLADVPRGVGRTF